MQMRQVIEKGCVRVPIISSIYWAIVPSMYEKLGRTQKDINREIYKRLSVNPDEIEYYSGREPWYASEEVSISDSIGTTPDGDWDVGDLPQVHPYKNQTEIPELDKVRSLNDLLLPAFKQRFENGSNWDETALWNYLSIHIQNGDKIWHGCETISDLEKRCDRIDELFECINSGYKSQFELSKSKIIHETYRSCYLGEILVDIGRHGNLLFVDGIHRLTIARLLDLDKVTVSVISRHPEFLNHS